MSGTKDPSPKSSGIAGIILAAGKSSRMGAFKPLLPFGDRTVVETCIQNFREAGVDNIVVVIGDDDRAKQLRHTVCESGVHFAINPDAESEMSASIACATKTLLETTEAVIINPVDHAAVPPQVIKLLIDAWMNGQRLVKPTWQGQGGHPVLIDCTFRAALRNLDPQGGLKAFLDVYKSEVTRLAVDSNYIARDMDTWDDYRSLHQELFGFFPIKPAD